MFKKGLLICLISLMVLSAGLFLSTPTAVRAANESANLDQCGNDKAPSPSSDGCDTSANQWVNGNLNENGSSYFEGDTIPYRMLFDNLSTVGTHTVTIEWDTTKSSKHAIDYIDTFNQSVLDANPCLGVSGCNPAVYNPYPIPGDPQVTGAGITPIAGNFRLYGGTINSLSIYSYADGTGFVGDKSARISITFTASVANPVLAWGGHIATRKDWGMLASAVDIPGSPYHTRLIDLDGAGGNQDRSLSASAVIFPGSITIIKDATPNGSTSFGFTGSPSPLANFSLVDDGTSANTQVFSNIINFTTYSVNESSIPAGWGFDSVSCSVVNQNGGSYTTSTTTVSIVMKEGEFWTCTYLDSLRVGYLTIIKHVVNDNGGSASASDWSIHVKSGSSEVTGSPQPGSEVGTTYTLLPGTYIASESGGPSGYTFTGFSGDCDSSGSVSVVVGQTKSCTLTNDDQQAYVIVVKKVINDNGGSAAPDDFKLTLDGNATTSGTKVAVDPGSHTAAETQLSGYSFTGFSGDCNSSGVVSVALGETKSCTLTNDDQQAYVIVVKKVINDNGGSAVPDDFKLTLDGNATTSGTKVAVDPGSHTAAETQLSGYSFTGFSGDCNSSGVVSVALGETKSCTLTNDDIAPILHLRKIVINDNGGTKTVADFTLTADGAGSNDLSDTSPVDSGAGLLADTWALSENTVYGYSASAWVCSGGTQNGSSISLKLGEEATCTITNDDQPGVIRVIKDAKPASGSFSFTTTGAGYSGFTLTGATANNGNVNEQTLNAGSYTVQEATQLGWILTGIGGSSDPNTPYNCTVIGSGGSSGVGDLNTQTATISLKIGDTVVCVFENTGQGATRTQGFWATHTPLANIAWFGGSAFGHTFPGVANVAGIGDTLICGRPIDTLAKLMGGFWSSIAKTSTGAKRSQLDQARMQLLQLLLAAELNASAFGSVPAGGSGMFAQWESALCGTNVTAIKTALSQAASFNTLGDSAVFTPGVSADSKYARSIANYAFWDVIV